MSADGVSTKNQRISDATFTARGKIIRVLRLTFFTFTTPSTSLLHVDPDQWKTKAAFAVRHFPRMRMHDELSKFASEKRRDACVGWFPQIHAATGG